MLRIELIFIREPKPMYQPRSAIYRPLFIVHRVITAGLFILVASLLSAGEDAREIGQVRLDSIPGAKFKFDDVLGQRVKANVENWLLVAPEKNPELCEVFAHREANSEPPLVPWVGEFAGKYLISAVQAMRMSDDPRLRETAGKVVARVIQLQAEDGYLGPWPKKEQLQKHWDLWENYHVMLGLLLWSEQTGDEKALMAVRKAADLICRSYLDTGRSVNEAGSQEMNMGVIHIMAILYRKTGEPRYLNMAKMVLKNFEQAGDYYRQGLKGEEFYRTPRPRWESLHSLQGMAELYRITGDEDFRRAFLHHWASIRRFDMHNTGGFSSGEQATGNPYANQAIETCCVVAWETVMIDALRLTGDSTIADDLELATFNAVAGAQHPSGQWCTYNTPMDGKRVPSHEDISFQARPGGMFLNCCSVNGPRGLGMLSEWGVMQSDAGLTVNFYGPMHAEVKLADGTPVTIEEGTDYPIGGTVRIKINPAAAKHFTLALRIPAWSPKTEMSLNNDSPKSAKSGEYLKLTRLWQPGDQITLKFNFALRSETGDLEQAGKISLYRGPILLAVNDRFNPKEAFQLDTKKLNAAQLIEMDAATLKAAGPYPPWLLVEFPLENGKKLRLIDFASAGANGNEYQSWLPVMYARPPRPVSMLPADGASLKIGPINFSWRPQAKSEASNCRYIVVIAESPDFEQPILGEEIQGGDHLTVPLEKIEELQTMKNYYWKVTARNEHGKSESIRPYKRFSIEKE